MNFIVAAVVAIWREERAQLVHSPLTGARFSAPPARLTQNLLRLFLHIMRTLRPFFRVYKHRMGRRDELWFPRV